MRKYEVRINEKDYSVLVKKFTSDDAELEINGKDYAIKMDGPIKTIPSNGQLLGSGGSPVQQAAPAYAAAPVQQAAAPVASTSKPSAPAPAAGSADAITAPIPGSVLEILVKVGDTVTAGQTVVKMEAMKMENEINAPIAGTVSAILVNVGDAVNQGQALVEVG